jgi:hypothetical protein
MDAPPQDVKVGDRIRLTDMPDDCADRSWCGRHSRTVTRGFAFDRTGGDQRGQDNGRGLTLSVPPDKLR